jgi:hypothetical protein
MSKKQIVIALSAMGLCLCGAQAAVTNSVSAKLTVTMQESVDSHNEEVSKWKAVKTKGTNKDLLEVFAEANPEINLSKKAKLVHVNGTFYVVDGTNSFLYPFMTATTGEVGVGNGSKNYETGAEKTLETRVVKLSFDTTPEPEPTVSAVEETNIIKFELSGLMNWVFGATKYNKDGERAVSESYKFSCVGEGSFEGEDAIVEGTFIGNGKGVEEEPMFD